MTDVLPPDPEVIPDGTDARAYRRTVSTADVLRALPYHSPIPGWHSHGAHLIPTDGCAACTELRARNAARAAAGGPAQGADDWCPACREDRHRDCAGGFARDCMCPCDPEYDA